MALPGDQLSYSDSWLLSQDFPRMSQQDFPRMSQQDFPRMSQFPSGSAGEGDAGMVAAGAPFLGYQDSQLSCLRREERRTELELVTRALENVSSLAPDMASKLDGEKARAQHEINDLLAMLQEKRNSVQEESSKLKELQYDFSLLNKQTMLAQFSCYEKERQCRLLQEGIDQDLVELGKSKLALASKNSDQHECRLKLEKCVSKMTKHEEKVERNESNSGIHLQLTSLNESVEILEDEMLSLAAEAGHSLTDLTDGSSQTRLKEEINNLIRYQKTLEGQVEAAQKQMEDHSAKIRQLELDCDVTKKRNAAQLRRLTAQTKETRAREKYWVDQCAQIRKNIQSFTNQYNK